MSESIVSKPEQVSVVAKIGLIIFCVAVVAFMWLALFPGPVAKKQSTVLTNGLDRKIIVVEPMPFVANHGDPNQIGMPVPERKPIVLTNGKSKVEIAFAYKAPESMIANQTILTPPSDKYCYSNAAISSLGVVINWSGRDVSMTARYILAAVAILGLCCALFAPNFKSV